MATDIFVNKQSVRQYLSNGCDHPFIIPEYQRPYSWTIIETETMFNDIWEFSIHSGGTKQDGKYFLGSIVTFENNNEEQEIIDGQQRITTLLLMLRAIYTSLQSSKQTDAVINFKSQIESCIWKCDRITGKVDYSSTLLTSLVINEGIGDNVLINILKTGCTAPENSANPENNSISNPKDNYSNNYNHLCKLYSEASQRQPLNIYDFIYALLNQVIILPICANEQETALTIFNTLNDRGLPLTDADIFKSRLYSKFGNDNNKKEEFIKEWKSLEEDSAHIEDNIQKYFNIEMYYLKAQAGNTDSVSSLRKFFLDKDANRLNAPACLLNSFRKYYDLSYVVYQGHEPKNYLDNDAIKLLDILSSYPNDYWKYPVYIYYNKYRDMQNFTSLFKTFLRKLILTLTVIWIHTWGVNAIKQDILKLNVSILSKMLPDFAFSRYSNDQIKTSNYITPHKDIIRVLLKLIAYNHPKQTTVLPEKWQIEHILPQKYQNIYFENIDTIVIDNMIQHIGNLLPFERKLNITASNSYFERKRRQYQESQIKIVKDLSKSSKSDWKLDDIRQRDKKIQATIIQIFTQWNTEYEAAKKTQAEV